MSNSEKSSLTVPLKLLNSSKDPGGTEASDCGDLTRPCSTAVSSLHPEDGTAMGAGPSLPHLTGHNWNSELKTAEQAPVTWLGRGSREKGAWPLATACMVLAPNIRMRAHLSCGWTLEWICRSGLRSVQGQSNQSEDSAHGWDQCRLSTPSEWPLWSKVWSTHNCELASHGGVWVWGSGPNVSVGQAEGQTANQWAAAKEPDEAAGGGCQLGQ